MPSLTSPAAVGKTFELVAETGPATADFGAFFARPEPDRPDSLDGVRDAHNLPLAAEPAGVRDDLDRAAHRPAGISCATSTRASSRRVTAPRPHHPEPTVIQVDLPDGPASPLVRSLASCLSSVTEVPLAELPALEDLSVTHVLASWKSWLAGRGYGILPIAEPASFQWAGWWLALVDGPRADGAHQTAVLAFGTPPGVVLSPQDPALLGRATADLAIHSAYAVASLDPVVTAVPAGPRLTGVVELLAVAPLAEVPMQVVPHARALRGRGLAGDRYATSAGTFSPRGAHRPGYELTLIAAEVVEELTTRDAALDFASTRRNVLTRGIDVNALVGRDFRIGDVRCRGLRLAEPCAHLERLHGPGLLRPLIHRGGLRVDILSDGDIAAGSPITTD